MPKKTKDSFSAQPVARGTKDSCEDLRDGSQIACGFQKLLSTRSRAGLPHKEGASDLGINESPTVEARKYSVEAGRD